MILEGPMALLSSATVLRLVDSVAIVLAQAYQLARARLASAASPIVRLLGHRGRPTWSGKDRQVASHGSFCARDALDAHWQVDDSRRRGGASGRRRG